MSGPSRDDLLSLLSKLDPSATTTARPSATSGATASTPADPDLGIAHMVGLIKGDSPEDAVQIEKMMAKMLREFGVPAEFLGGLSEEDALKLKDEFLGGLSEEDALELKGFLASLAARV